MDIYVSQKQFKEGMDLLGIDISECARMLGYHPTTAYRWMQDGGNIPQVVGIAMGLMLVDGIMPRGLKGKVTQGFKAARLAAIEAAKEEAKAAKEAAKAAARAAAS